MTERYRFGRFVVDPERMTLHRDGLLLDVKPRVLDLLLALVTRPNETVTRETLLTEVWRSDSATLNNLAQHVFLLRETLGEAGAAVQTVPRVGYRLVMDVKRETAAPSPSLVSRLKTIAADLAGMRTAGALHHSADAFREILAIDEKSVEANVGLARVRLRLAEVDPMAARGLYEGADTYAKRALELDSSDAQARLMLAYVEMNLRFDWTLAESLILAAMPDAPVDAKIAHLDLILRSGNIERAVELAELYDAQHPAQERIALYRGTALYFSGEYTDARICLESVLARRRTLGEARVRLAETLHALGESGAAIWHLHEVTRERGDIATIPSAFFDEALVLRSAVCPEEANDDDTTTFSARALKASLSGQPGGADFLAQAIELREPGVRYAAAHPLFTHLRISSS